MEDKVKVFASDDNLKTLGELLSNDSSRKIIYNLMNKEMYTNELATKLDMRVSLVIHHLKKLEELKMIEISEKKIKRKGVKHRFFKINSDIFITINKTKEELEEQGFLSRIFNNVVKFASIVIAASLSFFITSNVLIDNEKWSSVVNDHTYPEKQLVSIIVFLVVIVVGLSVERVYFQTKNKKNM